MNMSDKCSWKDIFMNRLVTHGVEEENAQRVYLAEMEARAFFDFGGIVPGCLLLQNIERDCKGIRYFWESGSKESQCPFCNTQSTRPNGDYYTKPIQDIPYNNKAVYHVVRFKKYVCENPACEYNVFVERFADFSEEDARKTVRFKQYGIERSLGCGCNHAQYELRAEGAVISNDTLGRYVKAQAAKKIDATITENRVKVLAVDDVNLRKGDKTSGCTVLLDEESHKVLIILKGTTKEITKQALEVFPYAQFFSRDRASAYAAAGAECGKIQIADRFHLIKNAQAAIEQALMASIPASIFIRDGDGWVRAVTEDAADCKPYFHVPDERIEEAIQLARLTPAKAQKYKNTLKLLELADKGLKTADIAKEMDVPYKDVQILRRTAASTLRDVEERVKKRVDAQNDAARRREEERRDHPPKTVGGSRVRPTSESIVEPYRKTVVAMAKEGANHRTIYPAIQEMGYTGSCNAIYQYMLKLRKEDSEQLQPAFVEMPPDLRLESYPRNKIYSAILTEASKSRPGNEENSGRDTQPETKSRPTEANRSPFSAKATALILGTNKEAKETKEPKEGSKKNRPLTEGNRGVPAHPDTDSIP